MEAYIDTHGTSKYKATYKKTDSVLKFCLEQGCYDRKSFMEYISKNNMRAMNLFTTYGGRDWERLMNEGMKRARELKPKMCYKDRLMLYVENFDEEDMSNDALECGKNIVTLLHRQSDIKVLKEVFPILFNEGGKKKCIYFQGESNRGKSAIIRILSCLHDDWEIGRLSPQGIDSSFWMQDLVDKELYHLDEVLVSQKNIDLEGSENLYVDVKYGDKNRVYSKPCLMATNIPVWQNASTAYLPIINRCCYVMFNRDMSDTVMSEVAKAFTMSRPECIQVLCYLYRNLLNKK